MLILGFNLDRLLLMDAGALVLAAGGAASGAASVLTRRIVFQWPGRRYRLIAWHGRAAVWVGLGFLVLGVAGGLAVLAHLGGMSLDQIRDALMDRPWRALVPVGFFLLANGIAMMIGFEEQRDPQRGALWNLLMSIPGRLGGLIGCAIGAAVVAVGGYELVRPQGFDELIEQLSHGWPW